jgi:hypothetical protein
MSARCGRVQPSWDGRPHFPRLPFDRMIRRNLNEEGATWRLQLSGSRAAKNNAVGVLGRLMNSALRPEPRMQWIQKLSEYGPVGVLTVMTKACRIQTGNATG